MKVSADVALRSDSAATSTRAADAPKSAPRPSRGKTEVKPARDMEPPAELLAAPVIESVAETTVDASVTTPPVAPVAEPSQPPIVAVPVSAAPAFTAVRAMPAVATPRQGEHRNQHGHMMNGRPAPVSRASNKDETFSEGDHVVYPTHGVGRVEKIAVEEIAGHRLELIHITFEENRMTLRVPVAKARSAGLRRLATRKVFDDALALLKGRARIKKTMWSRRAQEYEAKINSGDPLQIAEVVRDLHRNSGQPDQSFSERQIYEAALERLAAELAALDQTDKATASLKLTNFLKTIA